MFTFLYLILIYLSVLVVLIPPAAPPSSEVVAAYPDCPTVAQARGSPKASSSYPENLAGIAGGVAFYPHFGARHLGPPET